MNRKPGLWLAISVFLVALAGGAILIGGPPLQERLYESGVTAARLAAELEPGVVPTESHGPLAYLHRPGNGGPAVVLIHGFASEADVWLAMARHLPDDWTLYALDLPGHGNNPPDPGQDFSVQAMTRAVVESVDRWGLESFHVLGTSMGGNLAIRMALEYPDRIESLGLIAPAAFEPPEASEVARRIEAGHNPLIVRSPSDFETMLEMVFHEKPALPWPSEAVLIRRAMERAELREQIWAELWESRGELDDRLGEIRTPVLLVWGSEDQAVDISALPIFRERLQTDVLEIEVLEETGHSPMLERPESTAKIYIRFINQLAEPADRR